MYATVDGETERFLLDGLGTIVSCVHMVGETTQANRHSFFDEAQRIASSDYIPTEADVLRARTKTTGIYETRFQMGQLSIQCVLPTFKFIFTN